MLAASPTCGAGCRSRRAVTPGSEWAGRRLQPHAVSRPGTAVCPQRRHRPDFPFCSCSPSRCLPPLPNTALIEASLLRQSLIFSSCCWLLWTGGMKEPGGLSRTGWGDKEPFPVCVDTGTGVSGEHVVLSRFVPYFLFLLSFLFLSFPFPFLLGPELGIPD